MKIRNYRLNWLTITAGGLIATLLLASDVRATTSITTTTNNSQFSSPQLIAVAARKKKKKRIVRKKVRVRTQVKPATTSTVPTTSPTDITQTPPPPPPVTPPPAPSEPSVTREEVEALRKSNQELREELIRVDGKTTETNKKIEQIDKQQFSATTKLEGQVIFGVTGTVAGDFDRNTAAGYRTRLELSTALGSGTLTTRLQSDNLGSATAATTPDGSLSWTGDGAGTVGIDALKYEFPLSPQTQVVVAANAGASDDFADTINPYFDGDGASGSISAFGNRPSIYYTVQGAGVGIRHKFSDATEFSLGYLASTANLPTAGNGLFGGSYGALAQLTFKIRSA